MITKILKSKWLFGAGLMCVSAAAYSAPVAAFMAAYGGYIAAAMSAVSAISQASQQKQAAKYNEKLAENQAIGARQEAAAAADRQQRQSAKTIGTMQASYAASGVSTEGSPLEVLEESARNAELDRLTILWNGESRAQGYQNTAELERSRGKNAMASGYLSAAGSAMKGYAMFGGGNSGASTASPTSSDAYSDNVNQSFFRMTRE
jgi:hypothetical protein